MVLGQVNMPRARILHVAERLTNRTLVCTQPQWQLHRDRIAMHGIPGS
jgi:hypothetical protein